ncbi:MAG: hypothetical protein ABEJ92_07135 [Halobacteriales archaeon]
MDARGDVVRSLDPFKLGDDAERYWLVRNDDSHPFAGEPFIAVSLTTTPWEAGTAFSDDAWADGGLPATSFVLPWALHSPRVEDITDRVGRLTEPFCRAVLDDVRSCLAPE